MSLSAAKMALAVQRARTQSGAPEVLNSEPIAIIGVGCRLPGEVDSPDAYWQLLHNGVDAIVDLPSHRWPSTPDLTSCRGGFLNDVERFDAEFFGIPRREAERLDPQHRVLMEVIWESLWDARIETESLQGGCHGVFVAVYNNDYFRLQFKHPDQINAYTSTGTSHSAAVGRISFLLDWKGPSVAVDTACSSSLVAVHMACQSLRTHECKVAVAGGVSLILAPEELISLSKLGMLAEDSRCKTFDSRADGFVPGEGCGIVVLKRLSDALIDGDNIRAVIRGTAVNQDGHTTVLTAPNGLSQQAVIRSALANAHVSGSEISYVEAHGTGTALGDPIEVEALAEVVGTGAQPCAIGSAKTNFGHLEAAAGISGLIKVVLALERQEIPQNLHFRELNPHIQLRGTRLLIANRNLPWPRSAQPRFAGVSSFGFGGTNAHVVLEEAPVVPRTPRPPVAPHQWWRQRYWFAEPATSGRRALDHPLLGVRLSSPVLRETVFENYLGPDIPHFLGDHRPGGEVLLPMTACIEMFLAASGANALDEVFIQEACQLPERGTSPVQVVVAGEDLQLFSNHEASWKLHVTGRIGAPSQAPSALAIEELRRTATRQVDVESFYADFEKRGIHFGPAFRCVQELWIGSGTALARVRMAEEDSNCRIHPALLDGCFQALGALLPGNDSYLPLGVKRFEVFGSADSDLWSSATLQSDTGGMLTGDIRIFNADGRPVAIAEGLWLRKLAGQSKGLLCEIQWESRPLPTPRKNPVGGTWVIFSDAGEVAPSIVAGLEAEGARCVTVLRGEKFEPLIADRLLRGVVHLWGLDSPASGLLTGAVLRQEEQELCGSILQLVQNLSAAVYEERPRLWIVTAGAQKASANQQTVSVAQAPLLGLARAIRHEHPDLGCITIDLDPESPNGARVLEEILYSDEEAQIARRGELRLVPRLAAVAEEPENVRLEVASKGRLEELSWQGASRRTPGSGEVEIRVEATGLNFRDVLNVLGEYPGDAGPLGSECAGRITEVGEGVTGLAAGEEVVGIARDSFQSFVTTRADLIVRKPAALSMEESATLPVAYVTARYALETVAEVKPGYRILIHAAAGGVGLAAVAEAQRLGAEVFVTAGSEAKRAYLRTLGVRHVMNSRTVDYRNEIMERTGGTGVDVVLNSLSGEHIPASLEVLARGGIFVELGKIGIWDEQGVSALRPDIDYRVIDWGIEYTHNPEPIAKLYREIVSDAERGTLRPMPFRTFGASDVVGAFRWMAQARHTGKIIVRPPNAAVSLRREGSYLITGGLGALGLHVAGWMAKHGAGELVLVGRNAPGRAALSAIRTIEQSGVRVVVEAADVSLAEELEPIIREINRGGRPLSGVVHAAGVLDDGVLTKQTWERFARVMAPKVEGAWHLHQLTAGMDLDFFIMFSSLASLLGSPGQGNYAAANAFLDGLAHHRHTLGLPATSLNWGPWAGGGMAESSQSAGWQRVFPGIRPLQAGDGLNLLARVLRGGCANQVAAFTLRPGSPVHDLGASVRPGSVTHRMGSSINGVQSRRHGAELHGQELLAFLSKEVAKIMGIEDGGILGAEQPLFEAGLDSLMAVEFRNVLTAVFDRPLPSTLLFEFATLQKLAAFLEGWKDSLPSKADRLATEIQALDEVEAEALLNIELRQGT
jgi:acyl transferase domain-containing protein/acyl carrier protein